MNNTKFIKYHIQYPIANNDDFSDYEAYEEKEASRTHSVKFSEDSGTDKDVSIFIILYYLYF